jgi:hypothetical protein
VTALNGIILGQAALASRAVLDRLLDRLGLTFEQSVALRVAAGAGSVAVADLEPLRVPEPAAAAALAGLTGTGLLGPGGTLTPAGRDRFAELDAGIAAIAARLYGDVPAADLEVAGRVLTEFTTRARAELSTS